MEPFLPSQSYQKSLVILPINKVQAYSWGSKDKNCFVGQMSQQQFPTYAQFWMGTHPNGESKLTPDLSLKQYLNSQSIPEIQFLFKILSIEKCLSIQAHPNEQQAKKVHQQFPEIYVDEKDKPEMFLTLSEKFQLFLGFIDEKQLSQLMKIEPFQTLSSSIGEVQHNEKLMRLLERLVHLTENQLQEHIETLKLNLIRFQENRQNIINKILNEFGFDTGILVSCMLQYHILLKGSCFGIEAGVPHAYIQGQCFQLMKNSDNVVRLGLTPKKKDIPNLLKIIRNNIERTYCKVQKRQNNLAQRFDWNSYSILRVKLTSDKNTIQIDSNSIGIILDGQIKLTLPQSGETLAEVPAKSVFFVAKGSYAFEGQGQIFIASKY